MVRSFIALFARVRVPRMPSLNQEYYSSGKFSSKNILRQRFRGDRLVAAGGGLYFERLREPVRRLHREMVFQNSANEIAKIATAICTKLLQGVRTEHAIAFKL